VSFRSVGTRLSLALAGVVALALGLVYLIVVPSLRQRLVDAKLHELQAALPQISLRVGQAGFALPDVLETASASANARVVVYSILTPAIGDRHAVLTIYADSHNVTSLDAHNDAIAIEAADRFAPVSGTVRHGESEYAEVAAPVSPFGHVLLLSASLHDALANVETVKRRVLEAGLLALALAIAVGYGAAYLFARRIRRLEGAAERIAAGHFDEPVVDRSADELGQLARAFDRMRLRLSQLERARREFIGNASHELRTPLFSLRGFIELLTDEELDEPTRREFLETMREQVDRLQHLAEDLLDLTRIDAGRLQLERHPVDLREVAGTLAEEFRAVALAGSHVLTVEGAEAPALGDEQRILRIGRALVENALKHTPPGTPVRIRAAPGELIVEDDGPGIAGEHAAHVFDRFYRADGGLASGSGLGLAIARELAEAMGGTLALEPPARFVLRLPRDEALVPRENTYSFGYLHAG
jgi:signal transduction histidine kinase